MEKEKIEQFLRDAADFCGSTRRALGRLESEPTNRDLIHQSFRFIHSLKSESQLVGLEEIGAVAHEMEGVLDQIRRNTLAVGAESLGILFPMLDVLDGMISDLSASEGEAERGGATAPSHAHRSPTVETRGPTGTSVARAGGSSLPHFGEFERQLIREARGRGEALYRLTCEIEESAPLKYPKAYLVVNNLEVKTNVIRTIPGFESTDDELFRVFDVYYTALLPEGVIRESVDVDQIKSINIAEISYRQLEAAGEVSPDDGASSATRRSMSSMRVDNGRLDEIALKMRGMQRDLVRLTSSETGTGFGMLSEGISALAQLVADARTVRVDEELRQIPWLIQDLAAKLGKRVRVSILGGWVKADRRLLSMLSEPLVHLVRNAVDHGIEPPEERAALGKNPEGAVVISAVGRGGELLLQVGDDGRGISEDTVRKRAAELGLDEMMQSRPVVVIGSEGDDLPNRTSESLLRLLVRPGLSTRTEPTPVSGRGVGLDAIYQKVHQSLGGELRLQTQEGKGSLFTLSLPDASTMFSVLMIRCGTRTIGVPLRDVESVVEVAASALATVNGDHLSFEGLPIHTLSDATNGGELTTDRVTVVRLRGSDTRGAIYGDEILFERDFLEGRLELGEPNERGLRSVAIAGIKEDFSLLDVTALE